MKKREIKSKEKLQVRLTSLETLVTYQRDQLQNFKKTIKMFLAHQEKIMEDLASIKNSISE